MKKSMIAASLMAALAVPMAMTGTISAEAGWKHDWNKFWKPAATAKCWKPKNLGKTNAADCK